MEHVLFVCRQLTPETVTGYWYQKTGQCVWPFRLHAMSVKCHFQGENNSLADGCEPIVNDVHGAVIATMPVNKAARKQIHRKQTGKIG